MNHFHIIWTLKCIISNIIMYGKYMMFDVMFQCCLIIVPITIILQTWQNIWRCSGKWQLWENRFSYRKTTTSFGKLKTTPFRKWFQIFHIFNATYVTTLSVSDVGNWIFWGWKFWWWKWLFDKLSLAKEKLRPVLESWRQHLSGNGFIFFIS